LEVIPCNHHARPRNGDSDGRKPDCTGSRARFAAIPAPIAIRPKAKDADPPAMDACRERLEDRRRATAAVFPDDLADRIDLNLAGMRWFIR
jgi:hypothetical protein